MEKPLLIILAGLPGSGKTTLARRLAKKFLLVNLRVDCIEAPFCAFDIADKGYKALINIAKENLELGLGVILDTVNPLHISRAMFASLSKEVDCILCNFELKIQDADLHRMRVEKRISDIQGLVVPTWQDVINRKYEEWEEEIDGCRTVINADDGEQAFQKCVNILQKGR